MPSTPLPPDHLLTGVGHGDFEAIGLETVDLIRRYAQLRPDDRVLDVGSGLGRVSRPLIQALPDGTYDGLDTVPEYVEWCQANLGIEGRVRFQRADLYSSFYNPSGSIRPEEYRFPWPDRTFTLTIATSLFTHLYPAAAENYVREIYRTLQPGGRFFGSFFVLDGFARHEIRYKGSYPPFMAEVEHGMVSDPKNPDFAIALDSEWLLKVFQSAGFEIGAFERGKWRHIDEGPMYQDLVIARRPAP